MGINYVKVKDTNTSDKDKRVIVGDVEFNEETLSKVSMITPVPGGVGPMTITMLMSNLEQGWRR